MKHDNSTVHIGLSPGGDSLIADAVRLAGLTRGDTLLDVGCGHGDTIAHLIEHYGLVCTGVDQSEQMIAMAQARAGDGRTGGAGGRFFCLPSIFSNSTREPSPYVPALEQQNRPPALPCTGAAEPSPCSAEFDAVLFECVLSAMDDLPGAVRGAADLLAAGGRLIVADLCGRKGVTPSGAIDTAELEIICRACGLVPVGLEDRTADLDTFAAEVILAHGSFEAYFQSVYAADGVADSAPDGATGGPLDGVASVESGSATSAFCRLDPAGPPPGYFLAVYAKDSAGAESAVDALDADDVDATTDPPGSDDVDVTAGIL